MILHEASRRERSAPVTRRTLTIERTRAPGPVGCPTEKFGDRLAQQVRVHQRPIAASALAALKVDLCAQVRPRLKPTDPDGIWFATRVLQGAGAELPAGSP